MSKIYKQGWTFSPPARGTGFMLIGIGVVVLYYRYFSPSSDYTSPILLWVIPMCLGMWVSFSLTKIDTLKISKGTISRSFGIFPIIFTYKINLSNYDAAVMKPTHLKYNVKQGVGAGITINESEYKESFMGLYFKKKGSFEEELMFKGTGSEVIEFIHDNLVQTDLRLFVGVIKKGYEMKDIRHSGNVPNGAFEKKKPAAQ